MTLKPESFWRSTLAQTFVGIIGISSFAWWVRGVAEEARSEFRALHAEVSAVRAEIAAMDKKFVTQSQAERYAAEFRWENRGLGITVPDVPKFRDSEPNRYQ
jgi:hypothetical protein